ncbi:hypothetical protein G7Z17_g9234 [Cylindrodendrum hubeiense]|uniref:Heterokaryon incompatibility domain-containing protein n=1 Tax=Cylindrodendrum hubeiense TaxID=595255 RepID=A0A9P5GZW0_9HYPO|nr:hypothetical protein G7Z17_g9234 [Cylindrodendrum hubeiense]
MVSVDQFRDFRSLEQLIKSLELEQKQIDAARDAVPQPISEFIDYDGIIKPQSTLTYYDHQPLPSTPDDLWIRLVELQPSTSLWSPIECKLRHVRLAKKPVYDALSYAPGEPSLDPLQPVYIGDSQLNVSCRLADALVYYRSRDSVRVLWADEICIDQESDGEKNYHVRPRRDIYQASARTFIWLGRHDDLAESLQVTQEIIDAHDRMRTAGDSRIVVDLEPADFIKLDIPAPWDPCVRSWLELFAWPWFQDLSSVQDIAVAPQVFVLLGTSGKDNSIQTLSWDIFMQGLHAATELEYFALCGEDTAHVRSIDLVRMQYQNAGQTQTRMLPILLAGRHCEVSDPKDKVYELLGLIGSPQSIQVGYEFSLSAEKVYTDTAIAIMKQDGTLDLLGVPRGRGSRLANLPTWVPDWSTRPSLIESLQGLELEDSRRQNDIIPRFAASGPDNTYTVKLGPENRMLGVSGFVMTTIKQLHTINTTSSYDNDHSPYEGLSHNFSSTSLNDFRRCVSKSIQTWKAMKDTAYFSERSLKHYYPPTKGSVHDAFRQTIVAGRSSPDKDMPSALQFTDVTIFAERASTVPWGLGLLAAAGKLSGIGGQRALLSTILKSGWKPPGPGFSAFFRRLSVMEGRRMMMASDDEMLGIVPQDAEVGDRIALLKGASVPIVLRERGSGWEVIGEAYIHGVMNGERWDESKAQHMWLV